MYQDFFGLTCKPFSMTPDPRFIYLSAKHKEALAHLLYGIEQRSGFIELSGEVGAGKTTLLRTLLRECDTDSYRTAFIFNPRLSALDLLRSINREFGIGCDGSRSELFDNLNRFLLEQNAAGRTVLLVIDEAQNLKTTALEEIRLLSNLETETDKLVQIILVGQPELRQLLEHSDIRQLNQRIAVRYHLKPLDADETIRYIRHRLRIAGAADEEIFSLAAMRKIHRRTGGVPRRINLLCDRLLLLCFGEDRRSVGRTDVARACRELQHERRFGHSAVGRFAIAGGLVSFVALLIWFAPQMLEQNRLPVEAAAHAPVQEDDPPEPQGTQALRAALAKMSEAESLGAALTALAEVWRADFTDDLFAADSRALLQRFSLPMANFRGGFRQLLSLDAPSLVELTLPGVAGTRYLAVTARQGGCVIVEPGLAGESAIDIQEFERLWCGRALIPWRNPERIPYLGRLGQKGLGVVALQRLLQECGHYDGNVNGIYDTKTIESVTKLQTASGIAPDGRVGPQTLMVLYRTADTHRQPSLSGAGEVLP